MRYALPCLVFDLNDSSTSVSWRYAAIARWARQGWVDELTPAGCYRKGGTAEKAHRWLAERTESRCGCWLYQFVPVNFAQYSASFELAREVDIPQILYGESDYIAGPGTQAYVESVCDLTGFVYFMVNC